MIKVQLEFFSVPEAIIALNAIMNLPEVKATPVVVDAKAPRRGRADKGHKRGEYKPRAEQQADSVVEGAAREQVRGATEQDAGGGATDAGNAGTKPATPTSTVPEPAPAPVVPSPAEVIKAEIQKQQAEHAPVHATIGEKDAEAQKLMETLHGKKGLDACRVLLGQFGVSRIREIPTARRAEFLEEAGKAAA